MSKKLFFYGMVAATLLSVSIVQAAINCATPIATLRSYARAIHAQNLNEAMACISSNNKRETDMVKTTLEILVAHQQLSAFAVTRLGPPKTSAARYMASDSTGFQTMKAKLKKAKVHINGNVASLTMPTESGKLYFKKVGHNWKMDGEKLFHLQHVNKMSAALFAHRLLMNRRTAAVLKATAADIKTGKVKTWDRLFRDLRAREMAAMRSAGRH